MFPKERTKEEMSYIQLLVTHIALENQIRGRDATGFATFTNSGEMVFKHPLPAMKLVQTAAYKQFLTRFVTKNTKNILIHTRAGTKGSEDNSLNNHPIETQRFIGVHNGMIYNDDVLFKKHSLYRAAEVDSEVIFRLLDSQGDTPNDQSLKFVAEELSGMFTTAFVPKKSKNELYLIKNDNPVTMYFIKSLNIIIFASQERFLEEAIMDANRKNFYISIDYRYADNVVVVSPKPQTIMKFDTNKDNALEQLAQEPMTFKESSYQYWNHGYEDDASYFFRGGAAEIAPTVEETTEEKMNLIASIMTKLTIEETQLVDKWLEEECDKAWNQGWTEGRVSLSNEMEQKVSIASETANETAYDEGYQAGYEAGQEEFELA